jgi:hypothetical protein
MAMTMASLIATADFPADFRIDGANAKPINLWGAAAAQKLVRGCSPKTWKL